MNFKFVNCLVSWKRRKILLRMEIEIRFDSLRDAKHWKKKLLILFECHLRDESNSETRQSGSKINVKLHKSRGQTIFFSLCNLQKENQTICRLWLKSSDVYRTREITVNILSLGDVIIIYLNKLLESFAFFSSKSLLEQCSVKLEG